MYMSREGTKMQYIIFLSFFDTIGPSLLRMFETGAYREPSKLIPTLTLKKYGGAKGPGDLLLIMDVKLIGD